MKLYASHNGAYLDGECSRDLSRGLGWSGRNGHLPALASHRAGGMSGHGPELRTIASDIVLSAHALSTSNSRNALSSSGSHRGSGTLGRGLAGTGYQPGKHSEAGVLLS